VTHAVSAQDVMEAAFVLRTARPYFPDGTVHLVVVDPGVGTERRAVALRHGGHWFVGPDNGVFPLVLGGEDPDALVTLDRPEAWRTPEPSMTFHGRDIFASVAARLAAGAALTDVGSPLDALKPLRWARPMVDEQGIQGWIVHVDRFGNAISNIPRDLLLEKRPEDAQIKCVVGSSILRRLHRTYGEVAPGEPLLLFGSTGFLEVAVRGGNAAELLDIRKGDRVNLVFA
jgi:S-adenosylmethionine hydrolase